MKNKKNILVSLVSLSVLMIATQTVHADSANFSVTPKIGENQVGQNLGYFNLLLKPKQTQNVEFTLNNNSNQTIKVKTSFGTAFTSQSGNVGYTLDLVKPDPSLKINLKDYVKLPQTLTIKPKSATTVTATVTMPDENIKGVIAGGFNFEDASTSESTQKSSGVSITNRYRYVIGLVLQNDTAKVDPTLNLGKVGPDQVNGRNVITANLTNSAPAYLMQMNTSATVTKSDDKSVNYSYNNAAMEMAPNSNFNLTIPVSIQGVLNGKTSEPLKPGKYHIKMTVYGSKDTNGTHQTMVNGQVTKYDYKWTFDKDFTITGERATALNAKDATVNQNSGLDWLLIIGLIVIILLLIALIFLFIKRRKKEEQEDKTNEDEDKSI
ncbi:DUF916 and DUF3324 domain-containing protein [Lactococcus lactis]|uniref:DUF916 and DUF3324 domain-containing protein n=1 Tax=Lactococcus lactis TaxID=1358 RepID=UPI0020B70CD9|nr:DUF916 and DUF3324 domain-containing protein [Lactococcus lactis]